MISKFPDIYAKNKKPYTYFNLYLKRRASYEKQEQKRGNCAMFDIALCVKDIAKS